MEILLLINSIPFGVIFIILSIYSLYSLRDDRGDMALLKYITLTGLYIILMSLTMIIMHYYELLYNLAILVYYIICFIFLIVILKGDEFDNYINRYHIIILLIHSLPALLLSIFFLLSKGKKSMRKIYKKVLKLF